jgi:hypothetical protein
MIVSVTDVSLQFALVIFGVSLAWSLYTSMDHYPRLHRFGYMWYRPLTRPDGRALLLSWSILAGMAAGSLYSIYFAFAEFETRLVDKTDVWALPTLGLVAFYYAYVPYLTNRLILGVLTLVLPQDLEYFVSDSARYNLYVAPRMSKRTVRLFLHRSKIVPAIVTLESAAVIVAILIATPNAIVHAAWVDSESLSVLLAATVSWLLFLSAHIPYRYIIDRIDADGRYRELRADAQAFEAAADLIRASANLPDLGQEDVDRIKRRLDEFHEDTVPQQPEQPAE